MPAISGLQWSLLGVVGAAFAGLILLWRMETDAADKAREDAARFETLYVAEQATATEWKEFAERRAKEASDARFREGAAARGEEERQRIVNDSYRRIERLENEIADIPIPEACRGTVLLDAVGVSVLNNELDAIADAASATGDPAALRRATELMDGIAAKADAAE